MLYLDISLVLSIKLFIASLILLKLIESLSWVLAVSGKQKIGTMAGVIVPYPTLSEVGKRAAGSYYTPKLFSEKTKKIVRFLLKF